MKQIYLDYNATTPVDRDVAAAMRPYLTGHFGNPSSSHSYGLRTREAVEKARGQVAGLIRCKPDEIVFTSGGTESNNYAIKGAALAGRGRGNHIITSSIEHPAVIEVCRYLEANGFRVTYLPVDESGLVDPVNVEKAITRETILITIMHANNEVGTIQPVRQIAELAGQRGVLLHTDAAQSTGKIPTTVDELGVSLLSVAGHKLYAPKGIGALYVKQGVDLEKLIHGADHEHNRRAGTENVLEIVGLGQACEIADRDLDKNMALLKEMRDRLREGLLNRLDGVMINGHPEQCLPNTLSLSFQGLEADSILMRMDQIAASAGAACHSDTVKISSVLEAMKVPLEFARGTIRFSTGRYTTGGEIDAAVEVIVSIVNDLRAKKTEGSGCGEP